MRTLILWVVSLGLSLAAWTAFVRMFPGGADLMRQGNARLQQSGRIQAVKRLFRRIELVLLLFILTTLIRAVLQVAFGWRWGLD